MHIRTQDLGTKFKVSDRNPRGIHLAIQFRDFGVLSDFGSN